MRSVLSYTHLSQPVKDGIKSFGKMPIHDGREYPCHSTVIKTVNTDDVEVSGKSTGDGVTATPWWSHTTH